MGSSSLPWGVILLTWQREGCGWNLQISHKCTGLLCLQLSNSRADDVTRSVDKSWWQNDTTTITLVKPLSRAGKILTARSISRLQKWCFTVGCLLDKHYNSTALTYAAPLSKSTCSVWDKWLFVFLLPFYYLEQACPFLSSLWQQGFSSTQLPLTGYFLFFSVNPKMVVCENSSRSAVSEILRPACLPCFIVA